MEEAKNLLEIIKCFLYEKECSIKEIKNEEKLYKLAKVNSVSNFLENWSQENCKSEKIKQKIYKDYAFQIVKDTNENIEIENILNNLEENNIRTLIVKGAIFKNIYPQNYMREMCDIDILVDEKDLKKASIIMKNMGYEKFTNHEKHLVFNKKPFFIVEIHRKLIIKKDLGYEYFKDIWKLTKTYKEYKNIYQLDIENAYIFCILHLLIHFKFTGIKIKDILDVYLYNEKYKNILNYNKLEKIFTELGIVDFEANIKKIAYKWFNKENNIDEFTEVEKYILIGANSQNRVNYEISKNATKGKTVKNLLFPELNIMQEKYPVLKKAPILLPIMWTARVFKDVFSRAYPIKTRINTLKLIKKADNIDVKKIKEVYKELGIK